MLGSLPLLKPAASRFPPWRRLGDNGGLTRYARPCLPVKPLLMIDDVGMRSARHFWQRRYEFGCVARKDVGCGGDEDGDADEQVVSLDAALLRRRKVRLGNR